MRLSAIRLSFRSAPLLAQGLLAVVIIAIAVGHYLWQTAALERQVLENLLTVAHLKADVIVRTVAAQKTHALVLGRAPTFLSFLRNPSPEGAEEIARFVDEIAAAPGGREMSLYDPAGPVRLPRRAEALSDVGWNQAAARAIATGAIQFVDLRAGQSAPAVDMGFVAPILPAGRDGPRPVGAIALVLDAESLFGQQLTAWPWAHGATGLSRLVRRDGDQLVLFGQASRGGDGMRVLQRVPHETFPGIDALLRGEAETVDLVGVRGMRILAAKVAIAGTDWHLVVALERSEALAELSGLGLTSAVMTLLALLASGTLMYFMEQRRQLRAAQAESAQQHALRLAESQFRVIFEQAAVGVALLTPDSRFVRVNRRFCEILGRNETTLLASAVSDITHPEDRATSRNAVDRLIEGEDQSLAMEKRFLRGDGSVLWGFVAAGIVRHPDGAAAYLIAVLEDIDSRKRAEVELRHSGEQFRLVVEAAPNAMLTLDEAGIIATSNPRADRLFGYEPGCLVGQSIDALIPERFRSNHVALHNAYFAAGNPRQMGPGREVFGLTRDGREFPADISIVMIATESHRLAVATIMDKTDLLRQEAALRQAQKMQAIGNLTGGMAHDFNNILSVIIANLDVMEPMVAQAPEVRTLLNEVLDAALRGAELTQRLLAFARRQPLRPQPIVINELISEVARLLRRTLGEDIRVQLDLAANLWTVLADPAQVEATLVNLANNARDAMPVGGRLIIATGNRQLDTDYVSLHADVTPGDYVMIEVSDTGCGMSQEVAAQIFEPFFTTKPAGQGTGLGLSMVFGFIKQSGGHIAVYTEPGQGTTFRLYLPRVDQAARSKPLPEEPMPQAAAGETVLLVEDDDGLRKIITRQVSELGYRTISTANADEALTVLEQQPVDLLFTDIVMPGELNGRELAHLVLRRWPHTHVLLTSGFPDIRSGSRQEADPLALQILRKPYRKADLSRALRETLDG